MKQIKLLSFLLCIATVLTCFGCYSQKAKEEKFGNALPETLPVEELIKFKQSFVDQYYEGDMKAVGAIKHYGTYDDTVLFCIGSLFQSQAVTYAEYCGVEFIFTNGGNSLYAYRNGEFKKLEDAYKAKWISIEDISSSSEYFIKKYFPKKLNIKVDVKQNAEPGDISDTTVSELKKAVEAWKISVDLDAMLHCGNYNGTAVFVKKFDPNVKIRYTRADMGDEKLKKVIGYLHNDREAFFAYKDGTFLTSLRDMMVWGWLTVEEVEEIVSYYDSSLPEKYRRVQINLPEENAPDLLTSDELDTLKAYYEIVSGNEVEGLKHYATVDGSVVLYAETSDAEEDTWEYEGVSLPDSLIVYRDGSFIDMYNYLRYYEHSFTAEELEKIAAYHGSAS